MAEYIPKSKPAQLPTQESYLNSANDSSAKKYITSDSIENNSLTDSTSNIEHIISAGAAAKSLAMSVQEVAGQALLEISSAESALMQVDGIKDIESRKELVDFNESDVNNVQRRMAAVVNNSFNSVKDPNIRSMLQRRTQQFLFDARHTFVPIKNESALTQTTNLIVPEIEEVTVDIDKNVGAIDNFYVGITFNLPSDSLKNLRAVRVFRAEMPIPTFTRPLATLSPNGIQRLQSYRGRKNEDPSANQMRMDANSVPNSVSNLNYFDPYTGQRVSSVGRANLIIPPPLSGQNANSMFLTAKIPAALAHLDSSVLNDVNTLANIQKNPIYGFDVSVDTSGVMVGANINSGLQLGAQQQLNVDGNMSTSRAVIDQNNKLNFECIATFSPGSARMNSRRISGRAEFYFADESVSYGKGYKYFMVSVDNEMIQSARSIIATAVIEGLRIPERPSSVSADVDQTQISLTVTVQDQLVEKFEIYRFEDSLDRKKSTIAKTISDKEGFTQRSYIRNISSNNYLLIGECINPPKAGAQFVDRGIIPGRHYIYRIYSVDIFGNKSESPFEEQAFVPDLEQQFVDLRAPAIIAEVDSKTNFVKLTFQCDDEHVEKLRLERRDLTLHQAAFSTPGESPRVQFGIGRVLGRKGLEGEHIFNGDPDLVWTGIFPSSHHIQQIFIDRTSAVDHIYQYRMFGEDRYGNRTSYALTSPLLVVRRPFINAPTGLVANVTYDDQNIIKGVNVSWIEANKDKSADDLIGDQNALSASLVRTLYQLQRIKQGETTWQNFALMTETGTFDPVVGFESDVAPNFRPAYVEPNQIYQYRVQAYQSGAFISNFTSPVKIFAGYGVGQPRNFNIRTPDVYIRPFYAMLNWDTQLNSGIVDHWEIERAVVNNLAADRLNLKNPDDFKNIKFKEFRKAYRESSRFSSKVQDIANLPQNTGDSIIGSHYFMDTQIDFGNTYFYRIRAISPEGYISPWSYKGIKITSSIFEQKWVPVLTDEEKTRLSVSYEPMYFVNGRDATGKSTMSLQPEYSKPDWNRTEPRISYTVVE